MKPFLSIFGERDTASPLADLPVIFPDGVRGASRHDASAVAQRGFDSASLEILQKVFGGRNDGTYSPREAYALSPWMHPAIHAFAGAVATRKFVVKRDDQMLPKHDLVKLIARPNKVLRMSEFVLLYYTAALWRYAGEVFWQLEYEGDAKRKPGQSRPRKQMPTNIWIWAKEAVEPAFDRQTKEFIGWTTVYDGEKGFVDRLDMVHFPLFDPTQHNTKGPSRGTSLWQSKRLPLTNEIKAHNWNKDFFARGIAPSIAVINKDGSGAPDPGQEEAFMAKLKAKLAGKNGEPMALFGDFIIQQLEASHRDAQYIEGQEQNRLAVLAGNTPPIVLGKDDASYANAQSQIKTWWTIDLIPAMSFMCSCIDAAFFWDEPEMETDLLTDDVDELQEERGKRVERYINLIRTRHSPKVAAEIVGMEIPEFPGSDRVLVSYSDVPIEDLDAEPEPEPAVVPPAVPPAEDNPAEEQSKKDVPPAANEEDEKRIIRILDPREPIRVRAVGDSDELRAILEIIISTEQNEKLRKLAQRYHVQAIETGAKQVGKILGIETLVAIDDPRIVRFLEERGNLIVSVNATTAEKINTTVRNLMSEGATPEDIGRAIKAQFNALGDRHARTIARTEVGSGLSGGRYAQMQEEDVQRHEWLSSRDHRVRDSHKDLDGEVVEIGERFRNGLEFPQDPNGDASETINCFPGSTLVSFADVERAYRAPYSGQLVTIKTALGYELSGTPNHPILTDRGFVALGALKKGDRVVSRSATQRSAGSDPDVQGTPSRLDQVFDAIARDGGTERAVRLDVNFYGDRPNGDVDVVTAARLLGNGDDATFGKPADKDGLAAADLGLRASLRDGLLPLDDVRNGAAGQDVESIGGESASSLSGHLAEANTISGAASANLDAGTNEPRPNGATSGTEPAGESELGLSGEVQANNLGVVDVTANLAARFDAALLQFSAGGGHAYAEVLDDLSQALACDVTFDEVVDYSTVEWSGHVFTLQTASGMYLAENIVARNCRCLTLPATSSRSFDRDDHWDRAIKNIRTIESAMAKQLSRYFFSLRSDVLKAAIAAGIAK